MTSPRSAYGRVLVLVAGSAGIIAALAALALSWPQPAELFMARLYDSARLTMCMLVLGIALLIAWRAGDRATNITVALSLTFICDSLAAGVLFDRLLVAPFIRQSAQMLLFILGAAFYIRASQQFPRALTPADIASSPTIWGQSLPLRQAITYLLHPAAAWAISAVAAVIAFTAGAPFFVPMSMAITAAGLVYFYITLRGPDADTRHRVLWFFEAALGAALLTMFAGAAELALPDAVTADTRAAIQLAFSIVKGLTLVVCIAAAVFYAGAISPALIVRKTLAYGATVGLLLFLFAVVEIYLAHSVIHALQVDDRFASAVLGAIFGLAFHPLKHRIEQFLKRFAPGADRSRSAKHA